MVTLNHQAGHHVQYRVGYLWAEDDDSEEIVDQFYMDQVECMPIPEINWEKK